MFKFAKKKVQMVPAMTKNLPGFRRSSILEPTNSARNNESMTLVPDAKKYEAGLRSSRHDLSNSMTFDLGEEPEDFINDGYFQAK
jgi:hypothetical protein